MVLSNSEAFVSVGNVRGGRVHQRLTQAFLELPAEHSLLCIFRQGFADALMHVAESLMALAAFLSCGVVSTVEACLHLGTPRDRALLQRSIEVIYAGWYAPPSRRGVARASLQLSVQAKAMIT